MKLVIKFPRPLGQKILRQNHYFEKQDFSHNLGRKQMFEFAEP
jgi:hypothetical protein